MCGFAGYFNLSYGAPEPTKQLIRAMTDTLIHRGPDDGGVWLDGATGIALGTRRLAIIDLSAAGLV